MIVWKASGQENPNGKLVLTFPSPGHLFSIEGWFRSNVNVLKWSTFSFQLVIQKWNSIKWFNGSTNSKVPVFLGGISNLGLVRKVNVILLVAQSCLTLCNSKNCTPLGSSVLGILQARLLEWVAIPFSRRSSRPSDWTQVSCITGRSFTEPPGKSTTVKSDQI